MEQLTNRTRDALIVTSFQFLVIIFLGIPAGIGLNYMFHLGNFEIAIFGAVIGLFVANLFDIQAFGRVSP